MYWAHLSLYSYETLVLTAKIAEPNTLKDHFERSYKGDLVGRDI
jgi:hypothetical protein